MTWVAAEDAGTPLAGFEYGTRVEYDLTDGTTVAGKIVVQGTDKIGSAHGIELDTDVQPCELHWIGTGLVRREGEGKAAPAAPQGPKLSPAMTRAMDKLTGTLSGTLVKGEGVTLGTAKALAQRGLVHLERHAAGQWTIVLVEPEVQEITDAQLAALDGEEAEVLRPLSPARRYRALRHAHIARETYGKGPLGVKYGDAGESRVAVLRNRVRAVLAWQAGELSDREYGRYRDLAGEQWKAARNYVTDVWYIGTGWGEAVLTVVAPTTEEAERIAAERIKGDPEKYAALSKGFGRRRMTVGELVADRRYRSRGCTCYLYAGEHGRRAKVLRRRAQRHAEKAALRR